MTKLYVIFFSILYTLSFSQERVDDFKEVLILEEGFELQTNVNITKYKYSEITGVWSEDNKHQTYVVSKLNADSNNILITKEEEGRNQLTTFVNNEDWLLFKKSFKLGLEQNTIELKTAVIGYTISLSHRSISLCTYKKRFGRCYNVYILHYYRYGDIIRFNIISESKYDSYYKNKEFLKEYIEVSKDDFEKFLN